jgi:hypothetical protein
MANNWITFSEVIPHVTPNEETWIREQLDDESLAEESSRSRLAWQPDGDSAGFEWSVEDDHDTPDGWGRRLWLRAEESGNPLDVAAFVQAFLRAFRRDQTFALTWAESCSKLRVGAFGGGAVFVTAESIETCCPADWLAERERTFQEALPSSDG